MSTPTIVQNISTAGTYAAIFNQVGSLANDMATVAMVIQGAQAPVLLNYKLPS